MKFHPLLIFFDVHIFFQGIKSYYEIKWDLLEYENEINPNPPYTHSDKQ